MTTETWSHDASAAASAEEGELLPMTGRERNERDVSADGHRRRTRVSMSEHSCAGSGCTVETGGPGAQL